MEAFHYLIIISLLPYFGNSAPSASQIRYPPSPQSTQLSGSEDLSSSEDLFNSVYHPLPKDFQSYSLPPEKPNQPSYQPANIKQVEQSEGVKIVVPAKKNDFELIPPPLPPFSPELEEFRRINPHPMSLLDQISSILW